VTNVLALQTIERVVRNIKVKQSSLADRQNLNRVFDPDQSLRSQSFLARNKGECGLDELEEVMATLKGLILVTGLLAGGSSLVFAQNGPQAAGQPPVAGVADNHMAPGSASTRTTRHHGTKHHRMYLMSVNRTHKGSKLTPSSNVKPQMRQ
jgi:hypothetical protein